MKKYNLVLLFAVIIGLSACKDKDNLTGTGQFKIEFEHTWGVDEMEPGNNISYTTSVGDTVKISTLKYYVSNIVLTNSTGTNYTVPDSYYLINAELPATTLISISDVPAGDYTSVSFMIGVDSTHNVSGAQTGDLSTANGMFWDWNSGYVFFKLEGESPQSNNGMFMYHVGGFSGADNALRTVHIDFNGSKAEVRDGQASQAHISVDVAKAFDASPALVIANDNGFMMPCPEAVEMSGRYQHMFEFEHIHN